MTMPQKKMAGFDPDVMAGHVPAIHVLLRLISAKAWLRKAD